MERASRTQILKASQSPNMKTSILSITAVLTASGAHAALIPMYSQNFDSLPTATTSVANTGAINLQGQITQLASANFTNATWYAARIGGSGTTAMNFGVGNGNGNTGGLYSYAETSSSDRWLGIFSSGTAVPAVGLALVNTSGLNLTSVTISFTAGQWRSPNGPNGVVNTAYFAYGFSSNAAITSTNFLSSTAMTADSSGNIVSGARTDGANYGAAANVSAKIVTLSNVQWAANTTLFIRWQDVNDTDADAGLAINDLSISAVPAPGVAALIGLAGIVTTRRRK